MGRLDPLHETAVRLVDEGRHAAQRPPAVARAFGADDRLAVDAALANPQAGVGILGGFAENPGFDAVGTLFQVGSQRVVEDDRQNADGEDDEGWRCQELPDRDASGADDH